MLTWKTKLEIEFLGSKLWDPWSKSRFVDCIILREFQHSQVIKEGIASVIMCEGPPLLALLWKAHTYLENEGWKNENKNCSVFHKLYWFLMWDMSSNSQHFIEVEPFVSTRSWRSDGEWDMIHATLQLLYLHDIPVIFREYSVLLVSGVTSKQLLFMINRKVIHVCLEYLGDITCSHRLLHLKLS